MRERAEDAVLVQRCLDGHDEAKAAFAQLYQRHAVGVLALLRGLLGDEHAAQDALQESFVRLFRALPELGSRPVQPYLYRIARNLCVDLHRRRGARPVEVGHDAGALGALHSDVGGQEPGELVARKELHGRLRSAVAKLPVAERAVFLLRHDQGLPYTEVAAILDVSVRTAKYRMKAALERLGRAAERLGVTP